MNFREKFMFDRINRVLLLLLNLCFINSALHAQSPLAQSIQNALQDSHYIICIDGGGSKTELRVLDSQGSLVALQQNDTIVYSIKSGGTNINVVGTNGVASVLDLLLNNVNIEKTNTSLTSIVSQCTVIGGFAGAARTETKDIITNLFKKYGFDERKIIITSDADMALETIASNTGIILISGTGSICFGKKETERMRVGGLGKVLGDEGSGYYIGIHALKAALKDGYGWGKATTLNKSLHDYFKTSDLKSIIAPLTKGEIPNYQVAAIAPIVFDHAEMHDSVAVEIINDAANQLGKMLACMIQKWELSACPIYFFGGTFKNKNANQFIQKILQAAHLEEWETCNKAEDNPVVLVVQRLQKFGSPLSE